VGDQAVLSWDIGKQHGLMGLVRQNNRWWDALDAAPSQGGEWFRTVAYPLQDVSGISKELQSAAVLHNADVGQGALGRYTSEIYSVPDVSIKSSGGLQNPMRSGTSGYEISIHYASNNAAAGAKFNRIYARPPTPAEFLPYPTPYRYVSDAVMFFDIIIDAPKPVSFQKGTTFDVWFPFVLDDTLKYNLSFGGGQEPVGPIAGTVFDNVVHFELPGFTALPGKELMGEIDGDLH
jgi:hypothetical protein